ncbi:polyprenyl glycosylphosphotransferase [Sinomonas cyclohexanicum]|uniref:Polyprenyl glycosylphosphotransferase n=2 Tax=Sinomonas cyclohexanicum TaxID=322009 RepID=A0ABM7PXL0_SINCY|nr:polyprenyl glycosylphosphotransferase [Corynebacterium cyclohexanicum]
MDMDRVDVDHGSLSARREETWGRWLARRLLLTDFLVLVWVVFGVQIAWFGFDSTDVAFRGSRGALAVNYSLVSAALVIAWTATLAIYETRSVRIIGAGPLEYRCIADASLRLFGIVAIIAFLFEISLARGYILVALPTGIAVLVLSRWTWRQWLGAKRRAGDFCARIILVGSPGSTQHLREEFARNIHEGYRVVGECWTRPARNTDDPVPAVPLYYGLDAIERAMAETEADTLVITGAEGLTPEAVRRMSWKLDGERHQLILGASLTDVAGPRVRTRPVAGLPLVHVEVPRYEGPRHAGKRVFDFFGALVLIILSSPLLLALAAAVKATSPGPVIYRQERIGLNGKPFMMYKFRSMHANADDLLRGLLAQQGRTDQPLFKVENDPRITPVGRFIRKHSLDEFPQLFNVLFGTMSLVGPRPQRAGEVELYDDAARRRLLLKPGMSGMWQVGGRSTLAWKDALRLDLYYVENWSLVGDIFILWQTVKAVVAPGDEAA